MDRNDITSNDFDYDIYSGGSAQEAIREYREREKAEAEKAKHEAAEKKKAEYRKRFEGMSADELFEQPAPAQSHEQEEPAPEIRKSIPGYGRRNPMPESSAPILLEGATPEEEAIFGVYRHRMRAAERSERRRNYLRYGRYRTDEELSESRIYMFRVMFSASIGFAFARLLRMTVDCYPVMGAIGTLIGSLVYYTGIKGQSVTEAMKHSIVELILITLSIFMLFYF